MGLRICGTGSAVPEKTVTNDMLAMRMDTSDEWISSRTGIRSRQIAEAETTSSLAADAAKKALLDSKVDPEKIDLLLVATFTPGKNMPSVSCEVQAKTGCKNAMAYDLNAACSGFLFALQTACAYMDAGMVKKALIIGAETISKVVDWEDRTTCVLFGDGAGAVVVEEDKEKNTYFVSGSDGTQSSVLTCNDTLQMDGQEVFRFAVRKVPECIHELTGKAGVSLDEVDHFLLHQANKRILESVAKRLKQPQEKFAMNLDRYGNTSAASIPILLDEEHKAGKLQNGQKVVLSGFGAGLTWGSALLEWNIK